MFCSVYCGAGGAIAVAGACVASGCLCLTMVCEATGELDGDAEMRPISWWYTWNVSSPS